MVSIEITNDNKKWYHQPVEKALEYLFSCPPVTASYFIIWIFINIINYELVYSFLLEQITPTYAQGGAHKSVTVANDCFRLSNQRCLISSLIFLMRQSHRIITLFFNSYSPRGREIYFSSSHTLILYYCPWKMIDSRWYNALCGT